jgi:hypothetical protein
MLNLCEYTYNTRQVKCESIPTMANVHCLNFLLDGPIHLACLIDLIVEVHVVGPMVVPNPVETLN